MRAYIDHFPKVRRILKGACLISAATLTAVAFQNCAPSRSYKTVLPNRQSLLFNSGFERGTVGYQLLDAGGGSAVISRDAAYSGAAGVRLYKMAIEPLPESLPSLNDNSVYLLSFWARVVTHDPGSSAEPDPSLKLKTSFYNGATGSDAVYITEMTNTIRIQGNTWRKYEYAFEPGARPGFRWLIQLNFSSSGDTNNVVDIDDILIEEVLVE
ncbi:MAG: hypothetical protein HC883_03020 [Bdellovibrionaceae bacterium]|nr:hypothetical protein [Pseudobdellovibrionaceae bacterium]